MLNRNSDVRFGGGRLLVSGALCLGLAASIAGIVALTKRTERSILFFATLVPLLLVTAFWLLFAAGELLFPH